MDNGIPILQVSWSIFVAVSGDEYWCVSAGLSNLTVCLHSQMRVACGQCTRMTHLHEAGLDVYVVKESRPFRFGAGPKILSKHRIIRIILPLNIPGASTVPWLRVSVVEQDVPLLLSKGALK